MKHTDKTWEKDGFVLRPARKEDAEEYYSHNYDPLDPSVARFTGCAPSFPRERVVNFFLWCVEEEDRYDFLLVAPDGHIIGESVINEIDWDLRCANYRMALFHSEACGHGLGAWIIRCAMEFAFESLKLHRLELDVFSFNPRAIRAYEKAGFRREGVLRDAVKDGDAYADDILMAILEDEWSAIR